MGIVILGQALFCVGGAYCSLANRSLKYWCSSGGVFKISMALSVAVFPKFLTAQIKLIIPTDTITTNINLNQVKKTIGIF